MNFLVMLAETDHVERWAAVDEAVTLRPGMPAAAGPFAETVEQLGGLYLIDVPDLETAVEVSRLMPAHVTVEVRPTADG